MHCINIIGSCQNSTAFDTKLSNAVVFLLFSLIFYGIMFIRYLTWRLYIWLIQDVGFTAPDANIRRYAVVTGVSKQTDIRFMENVLLQCAVRTKDMCIAVNVRRFRANY